MRRPSFILLFALLTLALSGSPAFADSVSSTGAAGTITYTDDAGEDADVEAATVDADTVQFTTLDGDTIVEGANCVEDAPDQTSCDGVVVIMNGLDGFDILDAFDLIDQTVTLNGGDGDDALEGGVLNDVLNGDADDDFLFGDEGNDRVSGGSGNDLLLADPGDDAMDAGAGDDRFAFLFGDQGRDDMVGGSGIDQAGYVAVVGDPVPVAADVSYSLNDAADDGPAGGAIGNVHADVEDLLGVITELQEHGSLFFVGYTGTPIFGLPEGKATLRGNDGPNTLIGSTSDDDIDGLLGNDSLVGGDGNDTLRSADAFADRLKCGPGTDTAEADTLDVISDTCENVTRAEAGNANDVPEDLPPTVAFTSPPGGAVTNGVTPLTASAADDRGIASVQFINDDRILCTDTEAPYTCDFQPGGGDVGPNTLSVVAIDTAQQTASDRRVLVVPRFIPTGLSLRVRPGKDAKKPFRFTSTGTLSLPAQLAGTLGCAGELVSIQIKAGGNTISNRRVALEPDCTFRSQVTFQNRRRFRSKRALRVIARFEGSSVLGAAKSPERRVGLT